MVRRWPDDGQEMDQTPTFCARLWWNLPVFAYAGRHTGNAAKQSEHLAHPNFVTLLHQRMTERSVPIDGIDERFFIRPARGTPANG